MKTFRPFWAKAVNRMDGRTQMRRLFGWNGVRLLGAHPLAHPTTGAVPGAPTANRR